jgi:hypothetical protein
MTLEELHATAKKLATALLENTGPIQCSGDKHSEGISCSCAEERRPLTSEEKKRGWTRRPFYAYDATRMCDPCAAYWFATMCSNVLGDIKRREEIREAEATRADRQAMTHPNATCSIAGCSKPAIKEVTEPVAGESDVFTMHWLCQEHAQAEKARAAQ